MNKKNLYLPDRDLIITNGAGAVSASQAKPPDKIFLGVPTRDGNISAGSAQASMTQVTARRIVLFRASQYTNLELNYNMLLCDALNLRDQDGIKWFAMLHADVQPDPYWLDTLIDEAEKHDADLMSAHVPLKDPRQLSSTALSDPGDSWCPWVRLALRQIHHPDFPETVDTQTARDSIRNLPEPYCVKCPFGSQLLINTGCMVMRVDRPWVDKIHFHKQDDIIHTHGIWEPMTWTEDWQFAQDLHGVGARVMATRKVRLSHWDGQRFFSSEPDERGQCVDELAISVRAQRRGYLELNSIETGT